MQSSNIFDAVSDAPCIGSLRDHIYNTYGSVIYGICLNISGNEKTAAAIFQMVFVELVQKFLLGEMESPVNSRQICVIKHTYKVTLEYLQITDIRAALKKIFHQQRIVA
ncbi:MAG: hypothetical protein ABIX01_22730 [Chitinophagaceae bacterium]